MKRLFLVLAIICITAITQTLWSATQGSEIPAFHDKPPAKGEVLSPVLTQQQLANAGMTADVQKYAYQAVTKQPGLMHQLPCYCYCDRGHGHKSLHSCFESTHGANCGICVAEALYANKMSKKGWTPTMIRDGIIRQEYKQMDLQHPDPVL